MRINVLNFFNALRIKINILVNLLATILSFHRPAQIQIIALQVRDSLSIGYLIFDEPLSCYSISKNRYRAHMSERQINFLHFVLRKRSKTRYLFCIVFSLLQNLPLVFISFLLTVFNDQKLQKMFYKINLSAFKLIRLKW